jgi:hypothetical protein
MTEKKTKLSLTNKKNTKNNGGKNSINPKRTSP